MAHGLCDRNPAADAELHKLLRAPERKNRAALDAKDLPEFLKQADLTPVSIEKVNVPKIWTLVTVVKD